MDAKFTQYWGNQNRLNGRNSAPFMKECHKKKVYHEKSGLYRSTTKGKMRKDKITQSATRITNWCVTHVEIQIAYI